MYNLNNGAFLEGALPTKVEDIDVNKMPNINKESKVYKASIDSFLTSASENLPSNADILNIQESIEEAVRLYEVLKVYKEKKSFSNADTYMLHLAKLINELQSRL